MQASGVKPSRALPYRFRIVEVTVDRPAFHFINTGEAGVVFHVHDLRDPAAPPRRYTVSPLTGLVGEWAVGPYDLAVFGPNGFYRRYAGAGGKNATAVEARFVEGKPEVELSVRGVADGDALSVISEGYPGTLAGWTYRPKGRRENAAHRAHAWNLAVTHGWYDFTVRRAADPTWLRRFAGRHETGADGFTDPAIGGAAVMAWA
jgi:phospholipase C